MNLKDCYLNLAAILMRYWADCVRADRPEEFVFKFLDDKSFSLFGSVYGKKDYSEALRAVHTLKGIYRSFFYQII